MRTSIMVRLPHHLPWSIVPFDTVHHIVPKSWEADDVLSSVGWSMPERTSENPKCAYIALYTRCIFQFCLSVCVCVCPGEFGCQEIARWPLFFIAVMRRGANSKNFDRRNFCNSIKIALWEIVSLFGSIFKGFWANSNLSVLFRAPISSFRARKKLIRSRISFCVDWRDSQFLIRNIRARHAKLLWSLDLGFRV